MDEYIGIIKLFAGNFPPNNWAFCQGQLLPIAQNQALFAILGTTYGGNGVTNFALPDLRGRTPICFGQGPGLQNYVQGQQAGTETVTLIQPQIPAHTHMLNATTNTGAASSPEGALLATANGTTGEGGVMTVNEYATGTPNAMMSPTAIGMAGGNQPHENCAPYLALNYIICVYGIFPPHS